VADGSGAPAFVLGADCLGGVNLIKGNAAGARVVDNT